jgi:hypothetical protein
LSSSEQLAWDTYARLNVSDRELVDAWRAIGNDWVTSLLNSGVMRSSGRRTHPQDAAAQEWFRRRREPLPARRLCAEHEAAHAIVAAALGVHVVDVEVRDDDGSGEATHVRTSPQNNAAIAAAGQVWIEHIRYREYPAGDPGCGSDRRAIAASVDGFGEREAILTARQILRDHADAVMGLADMVEKPIVQDSPMRAKLVRAEIRSLMDR